MLNRAYPAIPIKANSPETSSINFGKAPGMLG
jgi:hypothetical protein